MQMWLWTLNHLQKATDPAGNKLYHGQRQGVTFALADALCWLLASRCQILDVLELEARGGDDPAVAEGLRGNGASSSAICATRRRRRPPAKSRASAPSWSLVTTSHPAWDDRRLQACFSAGELEEFEETMPGISAFAIDVIARRRQPSAEGRTVRRMRWRRATSCACRTSSPRCLSGSRLAKDRAADTVSKVMIPEALDYPA